MTHPFLVFFPGFVFVFVSGFGSGGWTGLSFLIRLVVGAEDGAGCTFFDVAAPVTVASA
jgi:hypothetical protein